MKTVKIYGLVCPKTNEIRYVGKTIQQLKARLNCHLNPSKNEFTYRANWIRGLRKEGLKPTIILLEECTDTNWEQREIYWIGFYSKTNDLVNYTKGGNGGHYVKISTKEKLAIASKERWQDEAYRKKMCNMSKELWKGNEYKENASNRTKQRWQDEAYKEKMCNMSKKIWQDETYRKTRLTDESKKKISDYHKSKKLSNETKNKIGEASKQLWILNKEKWTKSRRKKPIIVDGIEYESIAQAAIKYGIDPSSMLRRAKSDNFPNVYYKTI